MSVSMGRTRAGIKGMVAHPSMESFRRNGNYSSFIWRGPLGAGSGRAVGGRLPKWSESGVGVDLLIIVFHRLN